MVFKPWQGEAGTLAMPLLDNVPEGKEGWEEVSCPICGRACWKRPEQSQLESMGMKAACTMCALYGGRLNDADSTNG